jgi:adenylylsulfate kinase
MLEKNGVSVIASFIAPYKESREFVRNRCQHFIETHVSTPLEVCEQRDPKGLYAKVRKGEIKNFTGVDDPYEEPENPDLRIDTTDMTVEQSVRQILDYLKI